ncbi:class I SAM-dependent methyltransferase [Thermoflexus sp.]|uniref:class I SAM-dependent methyltransferase n=1 Tax=Thermoflexus sp. TaxID=1969742 RepID=UPI00176CB3BF|nr:class I SAM-dependent methyltransferase [Thermoflexus sp.]
MGWISAWMQAFFRWLYHEGSWAYEGIAALVSVGRWTQWAISALEHVEGVRVLEIGHGPGHLLAAMAHRGLRPVGLDLSFPMARRAQRRTGFAIPLVQGRAQALPFSDQTFDTVVSTFPAPFILEPATWQEAARVLRPGGRFVVLLGAWPHGPGLLMGMLRILYRWTACPRGEGSFLDVFRLRAQEAGLAFREWSGWDGPWHLQGMIAVRKDGEALGGERRFGPGEQRGDQGMDRCAEPEMAGEPE